MNKYSARKLSAKPIALLFFTLLLSAASTQSASAGNRAGLFVVNGNSQTLKRCVDFTETQITGLDLLQRAGVDLNVDVSNPIGAAVCRLDGKGCTYPGQTCFCQCQGSPCVYWSYWRLTSGVWKYSSIGASNTTLRNGDVDGWVWGVGNFSNSATPPPSITFDQICSQPTATAAPTATNPPPTNTSVPPTNTLASVTNTPLRSTPTNLPPTSTLTRAPSATIERLTNTPTRFISSPTSSTRRSVLTPIALALFTETPLPTIVVNLFAPPSTDVPAEPLDMPDEPASANTSPLSSGTVGGILLVGGGFLVALVIFALTLAIITRLS